MWRRGSSSILSRGLVPVCESSGPSRFFNLTALSASVTVSPASSFLSSPRFFHSITKEDFWALPAEQRLHVYGLPLDYSESALKERFPASRGVHMPELRETLRPSYILAFDSDEEAAQAIAKFNASDDHPRAEDFNHIPRAKVTQSRSNTIQIRGLDPDSAEDYLRGLFPNTDVKSSASSRTGYLAFNNAADAQEAIASAGEELQMAPFDAARDNRRPRFNPADTARAQGSDASTVYVGSLPESADESFVRNLFPDSAKVVLRSALNGSKYGFVHFQTPEQASQALKESYDGGIQVRPYTQRAPRGSFNDNQSYRQDRSSETAEQPPQLYVGALPEHADDEYLRARFPSSTKAYVVHERQEDGSYGKSRGFGFVHFASNAEVQQAASHLRENPSPDGFYVRAGRSQKQRSFNHDDSYGKTNRGSYDNNRQSREGGSYNRQSRDGGSYGNNRQSREDGSYGNNRQSREGGSYDNNRQSREGSSYGNRNRRANFVRGEEEN